MGGVAGEVQGLEVARHLVMEASKLSNGLTLQFLLCFSLSSPGVCPMGGPLTSISFHPLFIVDKGDIPWLPFFTQSKHQLLSGFPSGIHHFSSCLVRLSPDDLSSVCYGIRALGRRMDSLYNIPERSIFNPGLISLMELRILGLVKSRVKIKLF